MKGVLFTEFLEMIDEEYSRDLTDEIVESCALTSEGAYTAVGTYDESEFDTLVDALSRRSGVPASTLLRSYGRQLFPRFGAQHPDLITERDDALRFLAGVESVIHAEVRKLYPEARPPVFEVDFPSADILVLTYRSQRGLADLAHGLIEGALDHFDDPSRIERLDLEPDGCLTRFTIVRSAQ